MTDLRPENPWRARIVDDFPGDGVEVQIARVSPQQSDFVTTIGSRLGTLMQTVDNAHVSPEPLWLPRDALRALRDAADTFLGKNPNDWKARYEEAKESLEAERARIGQLIALLAGMHGGR